VKQEPKKAKENKEMIINRLEDLLDCVKKQSASKINKNFSEIDYYLVGLGIAYNSTTKKYNRNEKDSIQDRRYCGGCKKYLPDYKKPVISNEYRGYMRCQECYEIEKKTGKELPKYYETLVTKRKNSAN